MGTVIRERLKSPELDPPCHSAVFSLTVCMVPLHSCSWEVIPDLYLFSLLSAYPSSFLGHTSQAPASAPLPFWFLLSICFWTYLHSLRQLWSLLIERECKMTAAKPSQSVLCLVVVPFPSIHWKAHWNSTILASHSLLSHCTTWNSHWALSGQIQWVLLRSHLWWPPATP